MNWKKWLKGTAWVLSFFVIGVALLIGTVIFTKGDLSPPNNPEILLVILFVLIPLLFIWLVYMILYNILNYFSNKLKDTGVRNPLD
jgi:Na+/H+-dicarboxylate symporter